MKRFPLSLLCLDLRLSYDCRLQFHEPTVALDGWLPAPNQPCLAELPRVRAKVPGESYHMLPNPRIAAQGSLAVFRKRDYSYGRGGNVGPPDQAIAFSSRTQSKVLNKSKSCKAESLLRSSIAGWISPIPRCEVVPVACDVAGRVICWTWTPKPSFQLHMLSKTWLEDMRLRIFISTGLVLPSPAPAARHIRESASAVLAGRSFALLLMFRRARTPELKRVLPCETSKWTAKELLRSLRRIQQADVRACCNGDGQ